MNGLVKELVRTGLKFLWVFIMGGMGILYRFILGGYSIKTNRYRLPFIWIM